MLGHHTPARETRLMEFHWLADDGPHIVALDSSSSPIMNKKRKQQQQKTGRIAQSVTCLVTDDSLTADPGVASSITVRSHTFLEIDYEQNFYGHSPPFH